MADEAPSPEPKFAGLTIGSLVPARVRVPYRFPLQTHPTCVRARCLIHGGHCGCPAALAALVPSPPSPPASGRRRPPRPRLQDRRARERKRGLSRWGRWTAWK